MSVPCGPHHGISSCLRRTLCSPEGAASSLPSFRRPGAIGDYNTREFMRSWTTGYSARMAGPSRAICPNTEPAWMRTADMAMGGLEGKDQEQPSALHALRAVCRQPALRTSAGVARQAGPDGDSRGRFPGGCPSCPSQPLPPRKIPLQTAALRASVSSPRAEYALCALRLAPLRGFDSAGRRLSVDTPMRPIREPGRKRASASFHATPCLRPLEPRETGMQ